MHADQLVIPVTPLKKARKEAGLTQGELAKLVDCTQAHISDLEQMNATASARLADRICKALGLPVEQVLFPHRFSK